MLKMTHEKPWFRLKDCERSNEELADHFCASLFDKLVDLSGFRYDLWTHRRITMYVLLIKEYKFEDVEKVMGDDSLIDFMINYLSELSRFEADIPFGDDNHKQLNHYSEWHEHSRVFTDHLSEDMQPKYMLLKLFKLYDWLKENSIEPDWEYTFFTDYSTLYLEDYVGY